MRGMAARSSASRSLAGRPGTKSSDDGERAPAPERADIGGVEIERNPHRRVGARAGARPRHDADNLVRARVEHEVTPDDVGGAAERAAPEAIADEGDAGAAAGLRRRGWKLRPSRGDTPSVENNSAETTAVRMPLGHAEDR